MLSTRRLAVLTTAKRRDAPWSGSSALLTVPVVPGSDADRALYRRRLGLLLEGGRTLNEEHTQAFVGAELGVGKDQIGKWERGLAEPRAWELHRMVQLYGLEPGWVICPPDSIGELEFRIAGLRQAAAEAARADAEDERDPRDDDETSSPPDTQRARRPPRLPR